MVLGVKSDDASLSVNVREPKAEGYGIRIGSQWFRTVANSQVPIQIGTRDSLAPRSDDKGSIYENVLDLGYAWARTDLSGGEGLDWDPRELALEQDQATLDPIRFWDSSGINNSRPDHRGDQYSLRLARTLGQWETGNPSLTAPIDMAVGSTYIFIADGQSVLVYDGWEDSTPTVITAGLPASDIVAIEVSPNNTVMVTCENGNAYAMRNYPTEVAFTLAYNQAGANDLDAHGVFWAHGRFLLTTYDGIDSAELVAVEWDGTEWAEENTIDTATSPFWSVVESGPAVVAACGDGTVRTYTPNNDNSAGADMQLLPRGRTTMPEGESPILLGSNSGVLLIMSTSDKEVTDRQEVRIYQAEVLDARFDYTVGQLQLRREWLSTEHEGLVTREMTNTRDEIFWFVKEDIDGNGIMVESLWRFDVVTQGLTRIITASEQDPSPEYNLNGLVLFDDSFGAIDFTNNVVFISDPDEFQTFGYMIFPNMTFGLNTDITWIATVVEAHNLVGQGGQVELWRSTNKEDILDWDAPGWVLAQRLSSQGASNLEVPMQNVKSRHLALQLRIYSTEGATQSPKVTRVAIRGIPSHRDFIMQIPLNISDYVSAPGRRPIRVPGLGNSLHQQMLDLVGDNVEAFLIDPQVKFIGVVNNISEPITYQSPRGSVTRYCMMEFRGKREPLAITYPTGDEGVGLDWVGISTVGLGQSEVT